MEQARDDRDMRHGQRWMADACAGCSAGRDTTVVMYLLPHTLSTPNVLAKPSWSRSPNKSIVMNLVTLYMRSMSNDVVKTVRAERDKLRERREGLLNEVTVIEAELGQLEAAIGVFERYAETTAPSSNTSPAEERPTRGTQKRLITEALIKNAPNGLEVSEIQDWIRSVWRTEVSVNTVSVTLPRLRLAGKSRLEGRRWFHVPSSQNEAAATSAEKVAAAFQINERQEAKMNPPG